MRLINTTTYILESFVDHRSAPKYAILSHTWGEDEVTFSDFHHLDKARLMKGFTKIRFTCEEALRNGLSHFWVDTCCIDKSSSAELSEAINSMYIYASSYDTQS